MYLSSMVRRHERAAKGRLLIGLGMALLVLTWLVFPQALVFQHARQGAAFAGSWLKSATITALGGTPRQAETATHATLEQMHAVKGFPAPEMRCLALAIYHEAGGDKRDAQVAVGLVALNRARATKEPRGLCKVVYSGLGTSTGCLFGASCRNLGSLPTTGKRLTEAIEVANGLIDGHLSHGLVASATHFHDASSRPPAWTRQLQRLAGIGNLAFYGSAPAEADDKPDTASGQGSASGTVRSTGARASAIRSGAESTKAPSQTDSSALARQVFGLQ